MLALFLFSILSSARAETQVETSIATKTVTHVVIRGEAAQVFFEQLTGNVEQTVTLNSNERPLVRRLGKNVECFSYNGAYGCEFYMNRSGEIAKRWDKIDFIEQCREKSVQFCFFQVCGNPGHCHQDVSGCLSERCGSNQE